MYIYIYNKYCLLLYESEFLLLRLEKKTRVTIILIFFRTCTGSGDLGLLCISIGSFIYNYYYRRSRSAMIILSQVQMFYC